MKRDQVTGKGEVWSSQRCGVYIVLSDELACAMWDGRACLAVRQNGEIVKQNAFVLHDEKQL